MTAITIVAVSMDTESTVLYSDTGKSYSFPSDAVELGYITREVLPELARHGKALYEPVIAKKNFYNKLSDKELTIYKMCKAVVEKIESTDQLMEEAQKAEEVTSISDDPDEGSTYVAVTKDGAVAGIEKLDPYVAYSAKNMDFEGTKNLIKRMAKVSKKRKYSVDDLLNFLAEADLPITPEGDIIAYKMLAKTEDDNIFVDDYTRQVHQQVGSLVLMAESLVDPDRHQDCSQGLHIASRSYLTSFVCPICVLVKVKPEDVIAVPEHNTNKVRVCAYQILCKLPEHCRRLLTHNKSIIHDPEGQKILTNVFNHVYDKIIETVEITAPMGGGVVTSKVTSKTVKQSKKVKKVGSLEKGKVEKSDKKLNLATAKFLSNPRKTFFTAFETGSLTKELAQAAEAWRKKRKKSWKALGLDDSQIITLKQLLK